MHNTIVHMNQLVSEARREALSNAVKYTLPRDCAKIEIGSAGNDDEEIYFVCDKGVGFDVESAGILFGVFQRLHRAEEFKGTGVGLASVRCIFHRHGGCVWAEAQAGVCATFYFSLSKHTAAHETISETGAPPAS